MTVTTPDITGVVDQTFFLRPLGGPQYPLNYLDRFPDAVYNKSIDSHLVRFMYALLGPAGAGWLRKNYLDARLKLEDAGIDTFDLDSFYGDPLSFGRILEEVYDTDPGGLIPRDEWEQIRAKDAQYRNRALDYVKGARAGNTPQGMALVARSGLGHDVEIIENYKYIYDQLSDDTLGIPHQGFTDSTEEFIVLPRRETPQNEVQTLTIFGSPTGGTFTLFFSTTDPSANVIIKFNANAVLGNNAPISGSWDNIQQALEALPMIGEGNVVVSGGPLPDAPMDIQFVGDLGYADVPKLYIDTTALTGGTSPFGDIVITQSAVDSRDEIVSIQPRDQYYLYSALNRIKPVTSIVTFGQAPSLCTTAVFNSVFPTSQYTEVVRYVTGSMAVLWPPIEGNHWIESTVEHEAPRVLDDLQHHYQGFHNISSISVSSTHIGPFSSYQTALYPALAVSRPPDYQFVADQIPADYAEPLTVNASTSGSPPTQLINGIYPVDYTNLPGVPQIRYQEEQFWSSAEQSSGDEEFVIDLGEVQAVNYLYFETTRKPIDISVYFDVLDQAPDQQWISIDLDSDLPAIRSLGYDPGSINPWQIIEYWFHNSKQQIIYTRYLRVVLSRRNDTNSPFSINNTQLPFSIEVRNLRIARNTV